MEENTLYDRIGETDFNPTYVDGQTLQHLDMNKIVSITKEGINENYYDIQKLQNGTKTVGNAVQLDGAVLSKYVDEPLQANDNKIPTSQQAKEYVDGLFSEFSPPIRGVNYWTDEDKQEIIDEASSDVLESVDTEIDEAIAEIQSTAFTTFDVVDGKLIAGYSKSDEDYYFQLNGNKLEVVIANEY